MRRSAILLMLVSLAACAQAFEGRVASRLADAGLPRPMAECMAERWVKRLSVVQLQKISGLSEDLRRERSEGKLTAGRFLDRVRSVDDPEIFKVVSSSAAVCSIRL